MLRSVFNLCVVLRGKTSEVNLFLLPSRSVEKRVEINGYQNNAINNHLFLSPCNYDRNRGIPFRTIIGWKLQPKWTQKMHRRRKKISVFLMSLWNALVQLKMATSDISLASFINLSVIHGDFSRHSHSTGVINAIFIDESNFEAMVSRLAWVNRRKETNRRRVFILRFQFD